MALEMESLKRIGFRAMGTDVELAVIPEPFHSSADVEQAFWKARQRIAFLEQRLSRFDPRSDVSYINQNQGHYVRVSTETVTVVGLALEAYRISQGLFCPWMGAVIEQLGYNVSFEQIGPSQRIKRTSARDFAMVEAPLHVEPEEGQVRIDAGYQLDLGGLAKGWIVEQAVDVLVRLGFKNVVVNAGGDMVCRGSQLTGPWTVGIQSPWNESEYLFNLDVENHAMATSGTYRRRWQTNQGPMHHLLDPRTGKPSESDIVSASVLAGRLTGAEVLAKTALLLGRDRGIRWLETQPQRGFVLITKDEEVLHAWNSSMSAKSLR